VPKPLLSIPLNGFLVEELERRGIDVGSFNSIEWIPERLSKDVDATKVMFFQFH